jgi:queuine tRNA-ribosyltransferase
METPAFMPVGTAGTVKAVSQDILEDLGAQIILGNTYHLYLRPGHELVRKLGGLHKFMSWERALLTDSGGFQVFSLSELRKVKEEGVSFRSHLDGTSHLFTPERSMEIQIALGADIVMAFDECTEHPAERERARASMEMTLRWAKRSKDYFEAHKHEVPWVIGTSGHREIGESENQNLNHKGHEEAQRDRISDPAQPRAAAVHSSISPELPTAPALFGIVQGGMYADLRRESAERTVELDFPGYAIGGLSVGESRAKTMEMIATVLEILPKDKPRYVMGVGYPEEIVQYAAMGVDMMDCVLPTRAARHGLLFTSEGRINIKNARYAQDQGPADPKCACRVCARYTRAYLRHLFVSAEPLAGVLNTVHNLAFYLDTMRSVRHAINLGDLSGILSGGVSLT